VRALLNEYDVDVDEIRDVTVKQLFTHPGYVRRQLIMLTIVWLFYSTSFVATNLYITDFMTRVKGITGSQASLILLVSGGIGFFFYVLGGLMGERWGRREVLIGTALLVAPLNLLFLFVNQYALIAVVYFFIYQVTNGTWSGAGYAYQAESFPHPRARDRCRFPGSDVRRGSPDRLGAVDHTRDLRHPHRGLGDHRRRLGTGPVDDVAAAQDTPRTGAGGDNRLQSAM
jgi:nitrate/nitrite transporter NarK